MPRGEAVKALPTEIDRNGSRRSPLGATHSQARLAANRSHPSVGVRHRSRRPALARGVPHHNGTIRGPEPRGLDRGVDLGDCGDARAAMPRRSASLKDIGVAPPDFPVGGESRTQRWALLRPRSSGVPRAGEVVRVAAGLGGSVGERGVAAGSAVDVGGRLVGGEVAPGRGGGEGGGRVSISKPRIQRMG